jgi:hypothetical protein
MKKYKDPRFIYFEAPALVYASCHVHYLNCYSFSSILQLTGRTLWVPRLSSYVSNKQNKQKKNSVAFSPQVNYTDWATATWRRNLVPTFADIGVSCGQRGGSPYSR